MDKTGRNDPCPCGSGKKYKKCCLPKHEAAERERLAEEQARRDERAAAHRSSIHEVRAAIAAKLAEAEHAGRDLVVRFPDVHDGYDRLGMVHEARGENQQAADCYRKAIELIRRHPNDYDAEFEDLFARLIAKLDPPAAT